MSDSRPTNPRLPRPPRLLWMVRRICPDGSSSQLHYWQPFASEAAAYREVDRLAHPRPSVLEPNPVPREAVVVGPYRLEKK